MKVKRYGFFYTNNDKVSVVPTTTFFDDLSDIDIFTMEYTEKEFREILEKEYPILKPKLVNADFFIGRIEEEIDASHHEFTFYEPIFFPKRKYPFDYDVYEEFYELANLRSTNISNSKTEKKKTSLAFELNNPHFQKITRMLVSNILNDYNKKKYFLSSKNITNPKLKEYLQKAQTTNQEKYIYSKILEKLKSYKELRGVLLEYYNVSLSQYQNFKEKSKQRMDYFYPSDLFGYSPFCFYTTITEANMDPFKREVPSDVYEEIKNMKRKY